MVMEAADFFGRGWKESYRDQGPLTMYEKEISSALNKLGLWAS